MTSQIFKFKLSNKILFELLDSISIKNDKYYIVNNDSYKKGLFNNLIPNFLEQCKSYYFISKHKYLNRKLTYNTFITVLRQICNYNKINYTSQIKYNKSKYEIIYYIGIDENG